MLKRILILVIAAIALPAMAVAGSISGSMTMLLDQDTYVDLTAEGPNDWVHWGATTDEKIGGTAISSELTLIGSGAAKSGNDSRIYMSWTDGEPTESGTDVIRFSHTGVVAGNGFSFTVAATAGAQRLKIYVIGWNSNATLEATLSGGGTYTVDVTEEQTSHHHYAVIEVDFKGAGETLTVSYILAEGGGGTAWDNAGFQAAALTTLSSAYNPSPSNGDPSVDIDADLSWNTGTGVDVANHIVYLSAPDDPNLTTVTSVTIAADGSGSASYDPGTLEYAAKYTWRVDEELTDASVITGSEWSFTVKVLDAPPVVDAGENILTTLELVTTPNSLALGGSVTDDGTTTLTINGWEAFEAMSGGATTKVTFADASDPATTVTISEEGTYILKLSATDGTGTVTDQKEIDVYADACEAAKATGERTASDFDFDDDCIVGLKDFAALAAEWLNSTALTEGFAYDGEFGDPENALIANYWTGIEGVDPNNLLAAEGYPASPDGAYFVTDEFRATHSGDNYGQRIYGYIVAPVNGDYTFYIASDDSSRLFLSVDTSPVDTDPLLANQIAEVLTFTAADTWDKETGQASGIISLIAGNYYYVEVLHKEGTGDGHVSVGWKLPGETEIVVIPASALRISL